MLRFLKLRFLNMGRLRNGVATLALLTGLPLGWARGQAAVPFASSPLSLSRRLDVLLEQPELRHATVGVFVRSLKDGRVIYEKNGDLALVPASNQKLLTASAALVRLGPDFRFRTFLCRTGVIGGDGVLRGDLILRGTGDPSLTSERLETLGRAARAAGLRRVEGRIVADDSRFDSRRLGRGWSWDNEPFDYQPQISALNCDENVVGVSVAPGERPGAPAQITLTPPTGYVRVMNDAGTIAAGTGANAPKPAISFSRARARNEFLISGTMPLGATPASDQITVEEPALYAATRLAEQLRSNGVTLANDAPVMGKAPAHAVTVAVVESEPLVVLLRHFLKTSDNLYGEVLLKTLGAETLGRGTAGAGAEAVEAFLRASGVEIGGVTIADGSGLSRINTVTPRVLAALLVYMDERAPAPLRDAFRQALPVAGVDGTLRRRFTGSPAAGIARAKTGSLSGVSALSGYLITKKGEPLVFSILMNNAVEGINGARAAQDAFVTALMDVAAGTSTL